MELRHLRYFLAVADALHFTRAAEALHVSQPTLSQQIKELERELGAPLFDRIGRSVRLTSAGELFRRYALRAVREVETGKEAVADLQGLQRGSLRVGVTHSFSAALMPRAVSTFRSRFPNVGLVIQKTTGRTLEQGLIAGTLELGIAFAPPESAEIVAESLFEEDVVLITSRGHPFAERTRIRLAELDGIALVLPSREFASRRLLDEQLRTSQIRPEVAVEVNDIDSLLEIVRLGTGATVLTRRAVNDSEGLVLVGITHPRMTRTGALLWHRDGHRTAAAQAFASVIQTVAGVT